MTCVWALAPYFSASGTFHQACPYVWHLFAFIFFYFLFSCCSHVIVLTSWLNSSLCLFLTKVHVWHHVVWPKISLCLTSCVQTSPWGWHFVAINLPISGILWPTPPCVCHVWPGTSLCQVSYDQAPPDVWHLVANTPCEWQFVAKHFPVADSLRLYSSLCLTSCDENLTVWHPLVKILPLSDILLPNTSLCLTLCGQHFCLCLDSLWLNTYWCLTFSCHIPLLTSSGLASPCLWFLVFKHFLYHTSFAHALPWVWHLVAKHLTKSDIFWCETALCLTSSGHAPGVWHHFGQAPPYMTSWGQISHCLPSSGQTCPCV